MADTLKDPFALRMNINADPTSRTGAFHTGTTAAIVSSTDATPIVVEVASTTGYQALIDAGFKVFIYGHTVNTSGNGEWSFTVTDGSHITLTDSRATGGGAGGATGTIAIGLPFWIPCLEDGFAISDRVTRKAARTQHQYRGPKYTWAGHRNRDVQQIQTPLYPENAGFLLKSATDYQSGTQIPKHHSAQEFIDNSLGASVASFVPSGTTDPVVGRSAAGMVCGGWSMTFDRDSDDEITLAMDWIVNYVYAITTPAFPSIPTTGTSAARLGWPAQNPYLQHYTKIDLEFADATGAFSAGWTGDKLDLRSASLRLQLSPTPRGSDTSSLAYRANTWTSLVPGEITVEFQAALTLSASDYLRITELATLRKARVRFATVAANPSGSTTSATNLAAGGTSSVVASATGFHPGDVLILEQPLANKFNVVTLTSINGTTFTHTAADVAMDGSGGGEDYTVRNTGIQVKVFTMDISEASPPGIDGAVKAVNFRGDAILTPTQTTLLEVLAYNDDNAGFPTS